MCFSCCAVGHQRPADARGFLRLVSLDGVIRTGAGEPREEPAGSCGRRHVAPLLVPAFLARLPNLYRALPAGVQDVVPVRPGWADRVGQHALCVARGLGGVVEGRAGCQQDGDGRD
jgi:hypothetical protein